MEFFSTEIIVSLITLTLLEIVLGIDNVVFISIISGRVAAAQQNNVQMQSGETYPNSSWPSA